uniref:Uncharacterized protein n=1 Tax=Tanacetum cinerariifolium TaxID=118510 RepID=A0A6L2MMY0_TANCI|nr:hypothetical protein [Tanacetum cinerariifolium]
MEILRRRFGLGRISRIHRIWIRWTPHVASSPTIFGQDLSTHRLPITCPVLSTHPHLSRYHTYLSQSTPSYVADSDSDEDPKEDPEEDHADYPADKGDGDDEPSDDEDDDTNDEVEEPFEDEEDDEEEEEH